MGNFIGCPDYVGDVVTVNANGDPCDTYWNIILDPRFRDPESGDVRLQWSSPCIDAGDPTFPLDPDGTVADMGAFYFAQRDVDIIPPSVPQNLSAVAGDAAVTLTFSPNPDTEGVAFYVVYRDTKSFTPTSIRDSLATTPETTYIDSRVIGGVPYYYRVSAVDTVDNESGYSDEVSATPTGVTPDISLSATSHDFGDVEVDSSSTWTLVVSDGGNADLSVGSISSSDGQFTVSPTSFTVAAGDSQNVTVRFSPTSAGSKTATLIITSNDPDEGTLQVSLSGNGILPPPVAAFTASPTSGYVPLTVPFTDQSTGDITSYSWDFGDGGASTQRNPSHTYGSAGTYTVSLTVTGPGGSDTETKTNFITATASPPDIIGEDGTITMTPLIVAGQVVSIVVEDADLNTDPARVETLTLETFNQYTGEVETLIYTETGLNTGIFAAQVNTTFGEQAGTDHDGTFHVREGHVLTTTYRDALTSTGGTSVQFATTDVIRPHITLVPDPDVIVANGRDISVLTARVTDGNEQPLPDGTPVTFTTDRGTFENGEQRIVVPIEGGNGEATTVLTAPLLTESSVAALRAMFGGVSSDPIHLTVLPGAVSDLDAPPAPMDLVANGSSPSPWQNTPSFTLTWTNPPDASGIAKAHYKLGSEPTGNEDITGTASGTSPINVEVSQEGEIPLYLWLEDGSGNVDHTQWAEVILRYDGTPPTTPVLQAPLDGAWTNTMEVAFVWEEVTDLLSGVSRYLLVVDDVVVDSTADLSLSRSLSSGMHRWAVAAEDNAGNISPSPFWTIGIDIEAPQNPSEVSAWSGASRSLSLTDGAWYNHPSPHFEWSGASDETSGVSGYAVRFTRDTDDTVGTETMQAESAYTVEESLTSEETYALRVRAVDQAGNWSEASTLFTYRYDTAAPSITSTPVATHPEGGEMTVSASVTDAGGVQSVTLNYRRGGQVSFTSVPMSNVEGDRYEGKIPRAEVTCCGVEYTISASDSAGNVSALPEGGEEKPYCIQITFSDYIAQTVFPTGVWRMVSVPVMPDHGAPSQVLDVFVLGAYDIKKWRLFRFYEGKYHEYTKESIGKFEPGKAFWLHTRIPDLILRTGSGKTTKTDEAFQITLEEGWNDISCPFVFPVSWSEVMSESGDPAGVAGPYAYDGTNWSYPRPTDKLIPWEGYAVKNSNPDPVTIKVPPISAEGSTKPLAKPLSDGEWVLQVKVHATDFGFRISDFGLSIPQSAIHNPQSKGDVNNFLGFRENAQIEWDRWDLPEPPPAPGEYLRLYFPHEEWTVYPDDYTSDFRPHSEGEVWTFVVEGNMEGAEAVLSFEGVSDLPAGLKASLLDVDGRVSVDLREGLTYPVTVGRDRRTFRIVVGSADYLKKASEDFRGLPEGYRLSQNRPNPFNAETVVAYRIPERGQVRLVIYDLLGREVAALVDGVRDPGYFSVVWDGRDRSGKDVASGVYLCVLEAEGGERRVRKMLVAR